MTIITAISQEMIDTPMESGLRSLHCPVAKALQSSGLPFEVLKAGPDISSSYYAELSNPNGASQRFDLPDYVQEWIQVYDLGLVHLLEPIAVSVTDCRYWEEVENDQGVKEYQEVRAV